MALSRRHGLMYRVEFRGFVEWKTVEFLEELDATQFCRWCGLVANELFLLSCRHLICKDCYSKVTSAPNHVCAVDHETLDLKWTREFKNDVGKKQVRCTNANLGCEVTRCLMDLNDHLRESCAFQFTVCFKCKGSVLHKDMREHFLACRGLAGVFLRSTDVQSLVEDMGNARSELYRALAAMPLSEECPIRAAVDSASEVFARIQNQMRANMSEDESSEN